MQILSIIFGTVFMNRVRLASGNVKRNTLVQTIKNFVGEYVKAFNEFSPSPFIQILMVIVPIFDLSLFFGVYSLTFYVVVAIINFIVFRLVTNR